jgi:EAL domain-containing protein (putative c-di-GMP-specific phosphodiesterase class I)
MSDQNNMTISVNISFSDMLRKHLIEFILEKCRNRKGNGNVIFEILERNELSEIEGCRNFINKVRDAGCLVAIDDFGTGYSNFSNLLNVPTDIIKIDGSLIKKILIDNNAKNMVLSIINYCKQSGKKVVAEFVENKDLACELKALKVDYLQGYFYGRPQEIGYYRENFC